MVLDPFNIINLSPLLPKLIGNLPNSNLEKFLASSIMMEMDKYPKNKLMILLCMKEEHNANNLIKF
jgi:hypothetical protein